MSQTFTPSLFLSLIIAMVSFNSLFGSDPAPERQPMTGAGLHAILEASVDEIVAAEGNVVRFRHAEVDLICVFDETYNRMRILAPIKSYAEVTPEEKDRMLSANFHSSLDARYCASNGVLYAAYLHPLAPLTREDLLTAVYQVASLQLTFGGDYSSGLLSFGEPEGSNENGPI